MNPSRLPVKHLGLQDYHQTFIRMKQHIAEKSCSEIWVLEHHPVYTLGPRSLRSHIRYRNKIPLAHTDRGGQVTYHGPGQLIIYPLIHLSEWSIHILELVDLLEETTILTLKNFGILATNDSKARGVYINQDKIASIGLKVKNGFSYHGIAINIGLDLSPFNAIIPCGNPFMNMTNVAQHTQKHHAFKHHWLNIFLEKLHLKRYHNVCQDGL